MKKGILALLGLVTVFFLLWAFKVATPINRPAEVLAAAAAPWYAKAYNVDNGSLEDWVLDSAIPADHIPMPGMDGVYMVIDSAGNVVSYETCTRDENGVLHWEPANMQGDNVKALGDGLYEVKAEDGTYKYVKYVQNDDRTYAYVETDSDGVPSDIGTDATEVPQNYVPVGGGIYALFNPEGVMVGYRTRMRSPDGGLVWQQASSPLGTQAATPQGDGFGIGVAPVATVPPVQQQGTSGSGFAASGVIVDKNPALPSYEEGADGTYTRRETQERVETKDGYRTTYVTYVTTVYNADGTVASTMSDGPYVKGEPEPVGGAAVPDKSRIASTLDGELQRVSADATFDDACAAEIFRLLNADRVAAGLPALTMDAQATKAAKVKAADMAIYDYASDESPMYGTVRELFARFGAGTNASANVLKMTGADASAAAARFKADGGANATRMRADCNSCGIAVAVARGNVYVVEVFM